MAINTDYKNKKSYPPEDISKTLPLSSRKTDDILPDEYKSTDEAYYQMPESTVPIYMPQGNISYQSDKVVEQRVYKELELSSAIYIQAADLVKLITVQDKSIQTLAEIQNDLLMQLNSVFSVLGDLATAEYNYITTQESKTRELVKEAAKKSGIISALIGTIETLIGVGLCVVSGGANPIGIFLIVDGVTRLVTGSVAFFDPNLASNKWLTSFEQAGVFGIFDGFGKNGAMIAQLVFMAVMAVATCGASLVASGIEFGVNFIASIFLVVSTGFSLYGMIQGLIDQVKASDSEAGINSAQAASAGLLAWLLYTILKESGAQQAMEQKVGKDNAMLIEMAMFTVVGLMSGATNAVNRSLTNNKQLNSIIDVIKSGISQIATKIDSLSTTIKLVQRYENLSAGLAKFTTMVNESFLNKVSASLKKLNSESFNKLVITGNAVNNLSQMAANVVNLLKAQGQEALQKSEADLRYYEELVNLRKQLITLEATLMEETESELGKDINQLMVSVNDAVAALAAIMNSAIQYNPFRAG